MPAAVRILVATMLALAVPAIPAHAESDGGALVTFVRSGGLAGVEDHLRIERDGAARLEGNGREPREFQVSDAELRQLEAELEAAGFPDMEDRYGNERPIADGYLYRVTYEGRTVTCEQDAGPPALERVIDHLEQILGDASA